MSQRGGRPSSESLAKATLQSAVSSICRDTASTQASWFLVPGWRNGLRVRDSTSIHFQLTTIITTPKLTHLTPQSVLSLSPPTHPGIPKRLNGFALLFRVREKICCHPSTKLWAVINRREDKFSCIKVLIAHAFTYSLHMHWGLLGARHPVGLFNHFLPVKSTQSPSGGN